MPMTALIRNLGKMTSIGLLEPLTEGAEKVCNVLRDQEKLTKAKIHPFTVLVALKIYKEGHGDKGKLKWTPNGMIVSALDNAFYLAFKVDLFDCFSPVSILQCAEISRNIQGLFTIINISQV